MKKQLIIITVIVGISKILSFFRELMMSYYYGASTYTDIYIMASTAANILIGWMMSFQIVHTPLYQEIKCNYTPPKANGFTLWLIIIQTIIGAIIITCSWFKGDLLLKLIAKGFSEDSIGITNMFFVWALFAFLLNSICSLIISEEACKGNLVFPSVTNLFVSMVQILWILACGVTRNYLGLRFLLPLSAVVQLIALIMMVVNKHRSLDFSIVIYTKKITKLLIPVFMVYMMSDINSFIDKMFGSMLPEGSISALHYGYLLQHTTFTMFITAFTTVIYPRMAESFAERKYDRMQKDFENGASVIIILFSFLSFFIAIYSRQVITILFFRGAFDETAVTRTIQCTQLYLLALLPLAFKEFASKVFQAAQDMKTNMYVGATAIVINVVIDYILYEKYMHVGLALGTCIATYAIIPIILYLNNRNEKTVVITRNLIKSFLAIIILSVCAIVIPNVFLCNVFKPDGVSSNVIFLLSALFMEGSLYYVLLRKFGFVERLI